MHIKKLSHCCLVIDLKTRGDANGAHAGESRRILIDPGAYSLEKHRSVKNVDIVLITHEHFDHFHIESLKELVKHQPGVTVISNDAVGELLAKEGISHHVMKHGNAIDAKGVHIEAYGKDHALLHHSVPPVSNVGYFIEERFFFPGDAFTDPGKSIDVLALPVAGPWMKLSEAIDYALALKPRMAFPVHDQLRLSSQHLMPEKILGENGIRFVKLEEDGEVEVD